jgi:hypothetical protein
MEEARKQVLEDLKFSKKNGEKVRVMPIIRKSDWLPENHDGEFLNQGAKLDIVVPHDQNREHLIDPLWHLSEQQKNTLAKQLGLDSKDDLNPLKGEDNYWKNRMVRLKREGLILKTDEPYDYVRLCILLSDTDRIAPSWNNRNDKFTYRFAVVREGDENREEEQTVDHKLRAYNKFNEIKDNLDAMESLLWLRYYEKNVYKKPPKQPSFNWAKIEVGKMVENSPQDFIDIIDNPSYETKVLVYKGLKYGLLIQEGQQIRFKSNASAIGMFEDVVKYLDEEKHAEDRRILQDKIDSKEDDSK